MSADRWPQRWGRAAITLLLGLLLFSAAQEFYNIAQGTGNQWGEFSFKWAFFFLAFAAFCIFGFGVGMLTLWWPERLASLFQRLCRWREGWGRWRWAGVMLALILPIWFLQYTPWGAILSRAIRLLIWLLEVLFAAALLTRSSRQVLAWPAVLSALLLSGAAFAAALAMRNVTDYPFSLGWSEGNRLWDYSVLFGRERYIYDKPIAAYLSPGRQWMGGIPFLLPGLTIAQERLWLGLIYILPYLLLGWVLFYRSHPRTRLWLAAGLWAYLFLDQGPIHPPLILAATLVALAWEQPLPLAFPLIALAGYYAQVSRWTWMFAPAIWIVMLEMGGASGQEGRLRRATWKRALSLGLAGVLGGYLVPFLLDLWRGEVSPSLNPAQLGGLVTRQPLLWYRLFPNATYGHGILLGLLIAVAPLMVCLVYLLVTRRWRLILWQGLALLLPLLAFLGVGLVVSTKIGGGGDLHNTDMFLIALLFAAALAWRHGGSDWLSRASPAGVRALVILLLALPAYPSLLSLRPLNFAASLDWVATLTDTENLKALASLPPPEVTQNALRVLNAEVAQARARGEVLFLDQRQLLTFGYVRDVPLVPEYEKKYLMDQALSSNAAYFQEFYADLAARRFALIVSDPLRTPIKDSQYHFGEENNAWVRWVATPVLCYYEPKITLDEVHIQLLVPASPPRDCTGKLPIPLP